MRGTPPQSHLQFPLTELLGQGGNVRVLRALICYGAPLSVSQLVGETKLSPPGVRAVLAGLADQQIVVPLGQGRAQLFDLRRRHPLARALRRIFAEERARWNSVTTALQSTFGAEPSVDAAWYYGSVARGEDGPRSDLDVAIVIRGGSVDDVLRQVRQTLHGFEETLLITVSLVGLSHADVIRLSKGDGDPWWRALARDARIIFGERPEALAARLRRRTRAA